MRKEDFRLLTGRGEFSDDINLPGQAYAHVVRSSHAHAYIRGIDIDAAAAAPGVLIVLTAADYLADGLKPLPAELTPKDLPFQNLDGSELFVPPDYPLAIDKVRHVGEGIAIVIAETPAQAKDAAELVEVDYEALPPVIDPPGALAAGAPAIWQDLPRNLVIDTASGDKAATDAAFARAAHVTRMDIHNNRVNGVPMEPRAAVGTYDPENGTHTLYTGGQGVVIQKQTLCGVFGVAGDKVRVVCRDVGGGFGTRFFPFRESVLVVWAARRLGRPVKWLSERSELFLSDPYGRDLWTHAELALDAEWKFLGMRVHSIANIGSHSICYIPLLRGAAVTSGVYAIPSVHVRLQAVFTNTVPIGVLRGAGRPETIYIIERLIDTAAAEMGIDRIELRRRNVIPCAALPYVNPVGTLYDSGEFEANMDIALAMIDWSGFMDRRHAARKQGKLLGIGLANYIETATGIPPERAVIEVLPDGRVDIVLGTQSSGQGHETAFPQIVADWFGIPFDRVNLRQGDTDFVLMGSGSHSSRSLRVGGLLLGRAAAEILDKGKKVASVLLQAQASEVVFGNGKFTVADGSRSASIFEVAAATPDILGRQSEALSAVSETTTMLPTFPNGCHVCEVEVEPDTGRVSIARYVAVDDVGRVVNPMLVDGQTHGATAQGIGQALLEDCVYDPQSGQLLSGSFMDYAMPRADILPFFKLKNNEVPAPNNPLGIKGAGEGGSTGAPPAVINAVVDALREFGVSDIQMPATAERVWRAIRAGAGA
ncbi:MAG: xanthine dehydrogenase family protein molybdopterin-binding subunit [Bradyrhizobium sp.]